MSDQVWNIGNDDRYSRFRLVSWWQQDTLQAARVLVVGVGALGNEVLKNLALLGVGGIYAVDFDLVEAANLGRSVLFRDRDTGLGKVDVAVRSIRDLNADVRVVGLPVDVLTDVGLGLFRHVDLVIGCLDNREARLWINRCCWKTGTLWIDGAIQELSGVVKVFQPPDSACYECGMTDNDYRLINLRYRCPLLRETDQAAGKVPTFPTIASVVAGWQTQEALKWLHGLPVASGEAMVFNGLANRFYRTQFQRREDCLSHETYPEPIPLPLRAKQNTLADLFAIARMHNDAQPLRLHLDRDLVVSMCCDGCDWSQAVMRPRASVSSQEAVCPHCGEMARPEMMHYVDAGQAWDAVKLCELGIPPFDEVRVTAGDKQYMFLLADDRSSVLNEE